MSLKRLGKISEKTQPDNLARRMVRKLAVIERDITKFSEICAWDRVEEMREIKANLYTQYENAMKILIPYKFYHWSNDNKALSEE